MNILLITDKYTTVSGANVTYVKSPEILTADSECELADYLHEEVVRLAVNMYHSDKFKVAQNKEDRE
jgi:hypothetical protein